MTVTINIDLGKKCSNCGKSGACDNGLCLKCISKKLTQIQKDRKR